MKEGLVKRIDTVFVEVNDLNYSVKWYTDVLGLKMRWNRNGYAAFSVGETALTLVQATNVTPSKHSPFNFFTTNIYEVHQFLLENEVETEEVAEYEDIVTFDFKDPDGHILGFCQFNE